LRIERPPLPNLFLTDLFLDFTGTLALDGTLLPGVAERLTAIAKCLRVTVATADTFGTAQEALRGLPLNVRVVLTGLEKATLVRDAGPERVVAIGNGRNDVPMFKEAALRIAVMGSEGAAAELIEAADVVVNDVRDALDLLLHPLRLKATLRE
jgi:P-type E1-E2 ATPase